MSDKKQKDDKIYPTNEIADHIYGIFGMTINATDYYNYALKFKSRKNFVRYMSGLNPYDEEKKFERLWDCVNASQKHENRSQAMMGTELLNGTDENTEQRRSAEDFDLGYGEMGNGTVVWNRRKEINQDYETAAHIHEDGSVEYKADDIPVEIKTEIEETAKIFYKSQVMTSNENAAGKPEQSMPDPKPQSKSDSQERIDEIKSKITEYELRLETLQEDYETALEVKRLGKLSPMSGAVIREVEEIKNEIMKEWKKRGLEDFKVGKLRKPPYEEVAKPGVMIGSTESKMNAKKMEAWLRGWDQANIESDFEEHENRSEAMISNENAAMKKKKEIEDYNAKKPGESREDEIKRLCAESNMKKYKNGEITASIAFINMSGRIGRSEALKQFGLDANVSSFTEAMRKKGIDTNKKEKKTAKIREGKQSDGTYIPIDDPLFSSENVYRKGLEKSAKCQKTHFEKRNIKSKRKDYEMGW